MSFDFLGFTFRARGMRSRHGRRFTRFGQAISAVALGKLDTVVWSWRLHQHTKGMQAAGTTYTLAITDHTHPSDSFTITQACAKSTCADATAEWITETHMIGRVPLPDYGSVTFTKANTTAGTKTATISSFPHVGITAVDSRGLTDATVSKLTDGGATFSDIWKRSS